MPQKKQPTTPVIARAIASVHMSASRQAVIYVDDKEMIRYEMWTTSNWEKYEKFEHQVQEEFSGEIYRFVPFTSAEEMPQADERTAFRLYSHFVGKKLKSTMRQLAKILKQFEEDPWKGLPPPFFEKEYREIVWYSADCFYFADSKGKLVGVPLLLLPESSINAPDIKDVQCAMLDRWRAHVPENPGFIRTSTVTKAMNRLIGSPVSEIDTEIKSAVKGYYHPHPKSYDKEEWWSYSRMYLEGFVVAFNFEVISSTEFEIILHTKSWDYKKREEFIEKNLRQILKLAIDELRRRPNSMDQIKDLSYYNISRITMTVDCTIEIKFTMKEEWQNSFGIRKRKHQSSLNGLAQNL